MSLIDYTYFHSEINIAQKQSIPVQGAITSVITKYEPEYLKTTLGYAFWKLFNAGIADTSGRWYELRIGAEYNNCREYLKKWNGFTNAEKSSPISNYVYYWYMRENVTVTASVGEVEGKAENGKVVSPGPKMTRAWNEMVDQTQVLWDYLLYKKDGSGNLVYPEFAIEETECFEKVNDFNF